MIINVRRVLTGDTANNLLDGLESRPFESIAETSSDRPLGATVGPDQTKSSGEALVADRARRVVERVRPVGVSLP